MTWRDADDEMPYYDGWIVFRQLSDFGGGLSIELMPDGVACIVTVEMIPDAFVRIWSPDEIAARQTIEPLKAELQILHAIKNSAATEDVYLAELSPWVKHIKTKYDARPMTNDRERSLSPDPPPIHPR